MTERPRFMPRLVLRGPEVPVRHVARTRLRDVSLLRHVVQIGCGLILVICVLALVRPASVALTGTVVARSVRLQLDPSSAGLTVDTDLDFAGSARTPGKVRVQVDAVRDATPSAPGPVNGSTVGLGASSLRLTGMTIGRGGTLGITLARFSHLLRIEAGGGASFTFATSTDGSGLIRSGGMRWTPDEGIVTLRSDPARLTPMTLKSRLHDRLPGAATEGDDDPPLAIVDVPVTDLRFGLDQVAGTAEPFVSSISGGTVTVVATDEKQTLGTGTSLALTRFRGSVVDMELEPDGLHLTFTGRASDVALGPIGFVHRLTPSWFEILLHMTWFTVLCSALMSIWGAVVTTIFAKERGSAGSATS